MTYQLLNDQHNQYKMNHSDFPSFGTSENIPPGQVIESGGGLANHVHGGTGALYRRDAERSDIFGESTERAGKVYGNFYEKDRTYLDNIEPIDHSHNYYPYHFNQMAKHTPIYDNAGTRRSMFNPGVIYENFSDEKNNSSVTYLDAIKDNKDANKDNTLKNLLIILLLSLTSSLWAVLIYNLLSLLVLDKKKKLLLLLALTIILTLFSINLYNKYSKT